MKAAKRAMRLYLRAIPGGAVQPVFARRIHQRLPYMPVTIGIAIRRVAGTSRTKQIICGHL